MNFIKILPMFVATLFFCYQGQAAESNAYNANYTARLIDSPEWNSYEEVALKVVSIFNPLEEDAVKLSSAQQIVYKFLEADTDTPLKVFARFHYSKLNPEAPNFVPAVSGASNHYIERYHHCPDFLSNYNG
ncbi:MAG: hypothetical protein COY39_02560 [Alphaproteobacteria bacterium CG_4_10_14_0_8_um_filter_37_21]|nr:MAG: hypothetical protein COY39_02560 [Alphaproteobacteria bacterium CG_4_10_14_0_8_um_filter_37_21]